jgi:hypothetical protein
MATQSGEPDDLQEINRQLREALNRCDELLLRAHRLLRRIEQDNDPRPNN